MQRTLAICLSIGVLGGACAYAKSQGRNDATAPIEITALQQKRIELLQERVTQIAPLVRVGLVDRQDLIQPQMDLINAQLDYAQSNAEKRKLLTGLMAQYDALIQIAESSLDAPAQPPRPGQRPTLLHARSELLRLKSERIRVRISHDILK